MAERKARGKADKSGQRLDKPPEAPREVVVLDGGLMHRGSLARIRFGVDRIPDVHSLVAEDAPTWGPGWDGEQMRKVLLAMVGEGSSISKALKTLDEAYPGRIPGMTRVYTWIREMPGFATEMDAALEMRGDIMADASIEIALEAHGETPAEVAAHKLKSEALRWGAGKFSQRRFGDHAKVDMVHTIRAIPDDELRQQIRMLVSDPDLKGEIGMIQDAEILSEEDSQSAP